jgi:hypothetical protein
MENDEEFEFDKFMDRILLEEGTAREKPREEKEEKDPKRRLIELYTERVNNSIRYTRK